MHSIHLSTTFPLHQNAFNPPVYNIPSTPEYIQSTSLQRSHCIRMHSIYQSTTSPLHQNAFNPPVYIPTASECNVFLKALCCCYTAYTTVAHLRRYLINADSSVFLLRRLISHSNSNPIIRCLCHNISTILASRLMPLAHTDIAIL
jgi:hypothetical protein